MSDNKHSENELILGIKSGNKALFEICFKMYYPALYSYASTLLKDGEIAKEIVQETFIKIWESREEINIRYSLKSYLVRCIHNNCINFSKRANVITNHNNEYLTEIQYHTELTLLNFSEEILDYIISEETEKYIIRAIDDLPDQCRQIFNMSRFDQLTYEEIGQKLNVSVNTVKTQIRRAFDKLKKALRKIEEM